MKDVINACYAVRVPTLFWGPPGVGKTKALEAFAKEKGVDLIVPSVRSPEDIAVPVLSDGGLRVVPVADFLKASENHNSIVFVDELSTLDPQAQAGVLRFLDSGKVGDKRIPESVWRVAAANPPELAAGGWDLEPPTANRLVHIEWTINPKEWVRDFSTYWDNPPDPPGELLPQYWAQGRALVASYISVRPNMLLSIPKERSRMGRAWPSPRSWDAVSKIAGYALQIRHSLDEFSELIVGAVGPVGMEFISYSKELDLPDPEKLLQDPDSLVVPNNDPHCMAIAVSVATAVNSHVTKDRYNAGWKVLSKIAVSGRTDTAIPGAKILASLFRKHPELGLPTGINAFVPMLKMSGLLNEED